MKESASSIRMLDGGDDEDEEGRFLNHSRRETRRVTCHMSHDVSKSQAARAPRIRFKSEI
jgi:hypothetical protein